MPLLLSGMVRGTGKEPLQGSRLNASIIQLAGRTGGRGEALDRIAVRFGGVADLRERGGFARAGEALDTLNSVWRTEHILNYGHLGAVEMRMLVGKGNGLLARQNRLNLGLPLADTADDFVLCFDGLGGGELARRQTLRTLDSLEFSRCKTGIQIAAHLGISDLAHSTTEAVADQRPLIDDSLALKVFVTGKGEGFSNAVNGVDRLFLVLKMFARGADDGFGLMPEVGGKFAVCGHYLARRMNLLAIASGVRGDLRGLRAGAASALQIRTNLLTARAGCVKILLRVALDLRRAATPNGDLVTELAKAVSQFRLIYGGGELLRGEEALRLNGAGLAVVAFGHVKDHCMGVELRSNVTIDRAGGVVFELGSNKFGRGFRRMVSANTGLRIVFKLLKRKAHTLAVGQTHVVVTANKCGE